MGFSSFSVSSLSLSFALFTDNSHGHSHGCSTWNLIGFHNMIGCCVVGNDDRHVQLRPPLPSSGVRG